MRLSVILCTYNQPVLLEMALWGYAAQTRPDFQLVLADDGSTAETAGVIERMRAATGLDLLHVRHEHRGFRKPLILNQAILAASGDYLVFSDGDCVPAPHFVETHARVARPGRFLFGSCLKLPRTVSGCIGPGEVLGGQAFSTVWLLRHGWRPGARLLRLPPPALAGVAEALAWARPAWNGHNASVGRAALLAVNGFDSEVSGSALDRDLGDRLRRLGLRGVPVRYRAPCLHLYHRRPYLDVVLQQGGGRGRDPLRHGKRLRAGRGLAEVAAQPVEATAVGSSE